MNILQNIQSFLKGQQVDAAFITEPHNILYATGFDSNPHERIFGLLVFQSAEPFLICPFMEVEDAKNAGWAYEVVGHQDHENPWLLIKEAVESRGVHVQKMAIEQMHLTVDRYQYLQEMFPVAQYSRIDEHLQQMRNIKNNTELEYLRKAAELADQAIEIGVREIREGKTETEVIMAVESQILQMGAEKMSFETMVLSGPKTASPHGKPGDRKFRQGDFILFDLGVVYKGYCSDITRTVVLGKPTEKMKEIYETVRRAEQAAIDIVKPGIAAKDVDITARTIIEEAGYGDYFTHRIGHGLGISIHEFPSITNTNELSLEEGMVFTIEPGIYVPGVGGVRIEDDVVVTKDGVEVLTKSPKELRII